MNSYVAFDWCQKEGISEKHEVAKSLTERNFSSGCIWENPDDKDSRKIPVKQKIKYIFKINVGKLKNLNIL